MVDRKVDDFSRVILFMEPPVTLPARRETEMLTLMARVWWRALLFCMDP